MADPSTLSVKERMELMKKQQEEMAVKATAESYVRMTRSPLPTHPSNPPTQPRRLPSPPVTEHTPSVRKAPPPPVRNAGTSLSGEDPASVPRETPPSTANGSLRRKAPPVGSSTPPTVRSAPPPSLPQMQRPHSTSGTPPTLRKVVEGLPSPPPADLPPVPNLSAAVPPVPTTPRPLVHMPSAPPTYSSPTEVASQLTAPDAPPLLFPKGVKEEQDADCPPALPPRPVELPPPPPGRKTKPPPYKSTSDAIALKDFVGKHKLPQMVRVVAGIYDSMEEKRTMPTGESERIRMYVSVFGVV